MKYSAFRLPAVAALYLMLLLSSMAAHAEIIYTYSGPYFTTFAGDQQTYDTSDHITGYFTLSRPLLEAQDVVFTPMFFSFSDGYQTLDSRSPGLDYVHFEALLDWPSASMGDWLIWINTDTSFASRWMETENGFNPEGIDWVGWATQSGTADAWENDGRGYWTMQVIAPEPSSFLFLATGCLGAIRVLRRKPRT